MGVAPEPPGDSDRTAWGGIGPFAGKAEGLGFFINWIFFRGGRGIPFAGISFRADLTRV